MILKEMNELWGTPIANLKAYYKKFLINATIFYGVCALILGIITLIMAKKGATSETYLVMAIVYTVSMMGYSVVFLNYDKFQASKFYRRHRNDEVVEVFYNVTTNNLFTVLYCCCKRVKAEKTTYDYYLDLMLSLCNEDMFNARTIMKYLMKYESEESAETISLYVIKKKKRQYLVGISNTAKIVDLSERSNKENG